jgi:hypothetical protein
LRAGVRAVASARSASVVAVSDEDLLHVLLGDRGAALHALALEVGDQRAGQAVHVDALVLVEPVVLDRDDRLLQQGRDLR